MDLNSFLEVVKDNMQYLVGDEAEVEIKEISKNNGKLFHSITVHDKKSNCAPSMYLDEMFENYKRGMSIEEIMETLRKLYSNSRIDGNIDMSFFTDYERVSEKVVIKLINYDKNVQLLESVPHRRYEDLAICYYCEISDSRLGDGHILIKNEHIKTWGVDEERLYEDAMRNSPRLNPVSVNSLMDTVAELSGVDDIGIEDDLGILVVTNEKKVLGAATILYPGVLQDISDRLQSDLFIIPSSVHEVLVMPTNLGYDPDEISKLKNIVECVNSESVAEVDLLSYNIYLYDRITGKIIQK
ncbi:MAG: hypothetical protein E7309_09130 [Butyrivibrio sp.]|jgi:hypothetical protein|nr:hypothetical protein [Butyrivibrio sp.]